MITTILFLIGMVLIIGVAYIGLEVALYLKWAVGRDASDNSDFSTYAKENEGGILANYCG